VAKVANDCEMNRFKISCSLLNKELDVQVSDTTKA